jgi:hypothetical protein
MDTTIAILVRILETMFMAGILGSAVVLILTLIEDAKSLLPGDKKESEAQASRSKQVQPHLHASDPV